MTQVRRVAGVAVGILAACGLAACGSGTSSTATTGSPTVGSPPTAPPAIGSASAGLCAEVATVIAQQEGLGRAGQAVGTAPGDVDALHAYARTTKLAFDKVAPRITADLGSAPGVVRAAWSSLQPQVDQLLVAGASADSVAAFTRAAAVVRSSNAFVGASQPVNAFTHGACRTALRT